MQEGAGPRAGRVLLGARSAALFVYTGAVMGDPLHSALDVEMSDGEILVTLPGTTYTVTYFRPPSGRQLVSLRFPMKNDPRVQMNVSEFLIRTWKLAHNKAREPGWIV